MLAEYEAPPLDAGIDEALLEFIVKRKAVVPRLGRLMRWSLLGAAAGGSTPGRAALARVLADPTFELIPLKNVREQAAALRGARTVSVTASRRRAIEATVDLAIELEATGLRAIPTSRRG